MAAAVVELDALPDPVRPRAEHHHLALGRGIGLARLLVGAVHVRRKRLELGGAGVDALVGGNNPIVEPALTDGVLVHREHEAELLVAEPGALQRSQQVFGELAERNQARSSSELDDLGELREKPRIDVRRLVHAVEAPAAFDGSQHRPDPAVGRGPELLHQPAFVFVVATRREEPPLFPELQRPQSLEKGLLECPANRHGLANRLHLGRERAIRLGELLEVPPGNLHDDVVDRRLE